MTQIPQCPHCEGTLVKKEKEGREYWACPNWKPKDAGCKGYFFNPEGGNTSKKWKTTLVNGDVILLDEIKDFRKEMNQRIDSLGEFLSKKLKDD